MANTLKLGNGKWATGKDTLLSFSDTNNNYKPLPFSFSRASSGTVVNKEGLIETVGSGEPRIDFLGNTKGALLLEPQRTNSLQYSEDFNQSSWSTPNINVTSNVTNAPNGTTTADLIEEVTNGGSLRQAISVSGQLTFSFYLKYASGTNTSASLFCTDANQQAGFNLKTGVVNYVSGSTATIENVGNGWYRCSMTFTSSASSTLILFPNYQSGIGGVYAWGAQVEQGSYATSYIPTSGSAVTRVVESTSQTVPDGVIGQTEGTIFFDLNLERKNYSVISISDGSDSNRVVVYFSNVLNQINSYITKSNVTSSIISSNVNSYPNNNYKVVVKYNSIGFYVFANGQLIETILSDYSFPNNTLSEIKFSSPDNTNLFEGKAKNIKVYNQSLTDQEAIALTTI